MKKEKLDISIIIVNYHVKKELFNCIQSIIASKPQKNYEIIVVDNDENKTIKKDLLKHFPQIVYVENENRGYGEGNNAGAKLARGEYLFILNPDTRIINNVIDILIKELEKNNARAIAAPLLYDINEKPYPMQGSEILNPLYAVFSFSFVSKLFPSNSLLKRYWMASWDKIKPKEVKAVPGTAFVIRRDIFNQLHGFDEHFFLYFEELDLCKRVVDKGWKILMCPSAKVFHAWGSSTKKSNKNIQEIFAKSRFYYFRKHFGIVQALLTECVLRTDKYVLMMVSILIGSSILFSYRLNELMIFIGDQGWFYFSARDMLTTGNIPLVGIASSHPWLHQGAFWTYLLAGALAIGNFHPVSGGYLAVSIGVITVFFIYKVGALLFSQRVGTLAALLYATSPLVIFYTHMPYHTSPIPLFTLFFIAALYKWLQGKALYLPLTIFFLAVLYNFQIATFLLTIVFIIIAAYGLLSKRKWIKDSLTPRILILSGVAYLVPMLPMLLYDITHGFPQTVLFVAWLFYKVAVVFGYPPLRPEFGSPDIKTVVLFVAEYYQKLIYISSSLVAFTIALFSFGSLFQSISKCLQVKNHNISEYLLGLTLIICTLGILVTRTASEAYLPVLFPTIILVTALFFDKLISTRPLVTPVVFLIIGIIACMNIISLVKQNYLNAPGHGLADKINVAEQIVAEAKGRKYNLQWQGRKVMFENFIMEYEYMAWWLGNGPSRDKQELKIILKETSGSPQVHILDSKL